MAMTADTRARLSQAVQDNKTLPAANTHANIVAHCDSTSTGSVAWSCCLEQPESAEPLVHAQLATQQPCSVSQQAP